MRDRRTGTWLLDALRRCAREPLLHFLVLGAAVLALYRSVAPAEPGRQIVLSEDALRGLRQEHLRRTGVPPTPEEEKALIDRFVDNEVLYREALALGLDRGDIIVRRRLIQKMEFLSEATDSGAEPTDRELQAWIDAHPERYTIAERVALTQVFAASDRHGDELPAFAARLHDELAGGADPSQLGDPFLRGRAFALSSERELAGVFGPGFAHRVMSLPSGAWSEPIASSYGLHLVRIDERRPAERSPVADVRAAVRRDLLDARRAAASRRALDDLRKHYDVRIAGRSPAPAVAAAP
jgi:peptidyl-prolyl cis-trans isomerase C